VPLMTMPSELVPAIRDFSPAGPDSERYPWVLRSQIQAAHSGSSVER
jgi:hypothetical protein